MKKIVFAILATFILGHVEAKKVKFSVDMTGQTKSSFGIHVMGDFQAAAGYGADWTSNTCLMVQDASDTNIYHFGVDIPAFAKYEYKFINGDQTYEVEIVPIESQVGYNFVDNRWIYLDSLDSDTTELQPFVFGGNASAGMNMIRFLVDMTNETVSPNGVHVAGSFQFTNPQTDRMYSFGNNVYEIINYMSLGNYTYKFYNGNTLANTEIVPSSCATSGDRTINLSADIVLQKICFSGCSTCYPTLVENENFVDQKNNIYPNPFKTDAIVEFMDNSQYHHIAITDIFGRQVRKELNIQSQTYKIERGNLSKGVYNIIFENAKGKRNSQKLIVD